MKQFLSNWTPRTTTYVTQPTCFSAGVHLATRYTEGNTNSYYCCYCCYGPVAPHGVIPYESENSLTDGSTSRLYQQYSLDNVYEQEMAKTYHISIPLNNLTWKVSLKLLTLFIHTKRCNFQLTSRIPVNKMNVRRLYSCQVRLLFHKHALRLFLYFVGRKANNWLYTTQYCYTDATVLYYK